MFPPLTFAAIHSNSPEWNKAVHAEENYQKIGFATDVNVGTGRNRKNVDLIAAKAADLPEDDAVIDANLDDDLKVAMAKQRSTGKAPPKRPTPRQRHFVQQLVAAHGSDVDAMVRNVKINKMQHSKGQLMELIESVEYWAGKTGVDFRVPVKGLWRP